MMGHMNGDLEKQKKNSCIIIITADLIENRKQSDSFPRWDLPKEQMI
jgi:hypothetical protein